MRFGVRLAVQGEMGSPEASYQSARDMALEAEGLGFDSVWIPDHVINAHMNVTVPMFDSWTLLSTLAVQTKNIRLAGHTFNNALRNPAVLAKMAATLDVISGGRLVYSLGSAWFRREAESYGLPWDEHDDRVARLREAFLIADALWTQETTTFNGRFCSLKDAVLEPKPRQKPRIPFWVPGDSEATRALAAELADVWLIYSKPPEVISQWAEDMTVRRDGALLPMALSTVSLVGLDQDAVNTWSVKYAKEREHRFPVPPTPEDVLRENLWGSPDRCIERIQAYEEAGVEDVIIQPIPPLEGMRNFAREVMPAFAPVR